MRRLSKIVSFLLLALMIISAFPFVSAADASAIAEFSNFKAGWKGTGENKYFAIKNDFMDGTSNGAIAYAGVAELTEKISVYIDWALTSAYTADISVYALPLKDTDGNGTATAAETDAFYTSNLDGNKISSAAAPDLSEGILIASLSDYRGADGNWNFATLQLSSQFPASGEKAIFLTTKHKTGGNGLTGNFKNLMIKESSEGKQVVNISKSELVKSVTFTNKADGKSYDFTDAAPLDSGTYTVTANSYAPATYSVKVTPSEVTVTDTTGGNVTASSDLKTSDLPETNYDTVKNNVIEWNSSNGYYPASLNYMNSIQHQLSVAVAGAKAGEKEDADVYMLVDTTDGKFHTFGRGSNMQVNGGTVIKVPVAKDTKLTFNAGSFTYTINGTEMAGAQDYYYLDDKNGYAEINVINGGYASSITTTPLQRTTVSGSVTGAGTNGCLMFSDISSGDVKYAPIADGSYTAQLLSSQSYIIKYGTMADSVFVPSETNSTDIGGLVPSGSAQTQNISITAMQAYTIGGDAVDIKSEETLKLTDGLSEYDVTVSNGKWSAEVPNGVYSFALASSENGGLSPLSKQSFTVLESNNNVKHVLVNHPIQPDSRKYITVGTGCDYKTINEALRAVIASGTLSSEKDRVTIYLKGGELFREQLVITTPYITLTSDKDNPATVTWYYASYHRYYSVSPATGEYDKDYAVAKIQKSDVQNDWGPAVKVKESATGFTAENISFINSFNVEYTDEERSDGVEDIGGGYDRMLMPGDKGYLRSDSKSAETMAAAINISADQSEFYNCRIVSSQDTLFTGGGKTPGNRMYFKNCDIEGNVDYIFGGGRCVFERCSLVSAGYSDRDGGGYITANGAKGNDGYYLFRDCVVKNSSVPGRKFGPIAWGRNWGGDTSEIYLFNTTADKGVIMPSGWGGWGTVANAPMYVYDFSNPSVGNNKTDNMHGFLTAQQATEKYYSTLTMMDGWTPESMSRASGITLSSESIQLNKNDSQFISATVTPADAIDTRFVWKSSDESIATIDQNGKITAKDYGQATITAETVDGGHTANCTVTVKDADTDGYPYEIKNIDLKTGNKNSAVDVKVLKNKIRNENDYIIVSAYDKDGLLLAIDYQAADFGEATEKTFAFSFSIPTEQIISIKTFIWHDLNSLEPLAESKSLIN